MDISGALVKKTHEIAPLIASDSPHVSNGLHR